MKTAIIIGNGKIGSAIAAHLDCKGYALRVADHTDIDLADLRSVRDYFEHIGTIDVLVNAAGTYGAIGKIGEVAPEAWMHAIAVNLVGVYACCHHAIPHMMPTGHIITLAGGGADPVDHLSGYCSAKAALARMVQTLALEYPPLRVNLISPGPMLSRMQLPLLQMGRVAGGSSYDQIKRIADTGEGAVPVDNTLRVIDTLLAINPTGKWYAARLFAETPAMLREVAA